MDHKAIQDQLLALYDGELTGESRRIVEAHLLDCAECRAVMAQWKQVAEAAFQPPAVAPSEIFVRQVMRRIATKQPRTFEWPRWILEGDWLVPALGLAAVLIILMSRSAQQSVSLESLLLSNGSEPAEMQQILTGERPSADDVLALLMGEPS